MDEYNSIKDWMSSHDTHSHGIRYDGVDLEDEVAYPLEGPVDSDSLDSVDDLIDEARELADIFAARLSDREACACAMMFGKSQGVCKKKAKGPVLKDEEEARVKQRLSKLFEEFVLDYPQLASSATLKRLFSENVLEACEDIYMSARK